MAPKISYHSSGSPPPFGCACGPIVLEEERKKYGLPRKSGLSIARTGVWESVRTFLESDVWHFKNPALSSDLEDPLLKDDLPFGQFMMGFDFHVAGEDAPPKLIEVNTNAGGLATVISLGCCDEEKKFLQDAFSSAVKHEYQIATHYYSKRDSNNFWDKRGKDSPQALVIVDTNAKQQFLYSEMKLFAEFLSVEGIQTFVVSPEELTYRKGEGLFYNETQIDFVYNRLTDFRFEEQEHQALRQAAVDGRVVVSPHPATYVRTADKRNLVTLSRFIHAKKEDQTKENAPFHLQNEKFEETIQVLKTVVPQTWVLSEKPLEEWQKLRKKMVFKPVCGNGSKGVYRGDRMSNAKLKSLDPNTTIVQELCPPGIDEEDGTKWDFRVYSHAHKILGMATRHFQGQVMEMTHEKSGFRRALPANATCLMDLEGNEGE
eukprot:CAMPEP_0201520356 /NCGR_PEP_ID=MMETSP0161_2-20130828/10660_1 /ASSEMBLY_ACC=CAM_ASM_000251 /TAXON_ID=180227 /ORGANISM="Neoparamoeba aestuarina, Strain SoJaBio B1-5/56/2" /LENGTH=430 /DNA_ID=CAMNT_0047918677 /DNA_START=113 /DNA_END=1405 /DNA_ORIENTATION=+